MIQSLLLAINFLTILPLRAREDMQAGELGKAAGWFPLVGALVGGITAAAFYALDLVLPHLLAAALAAAVWIILTGGLHLDGLADCCDGLLVAADRERRLQIMKDPHHGTFAGIGLILVILLKIIGLSSLPSGNFWLVLPFASALSRWMLLPAGWQKNAKPDGLGRAFTSGLRKSTFIYGAIPVVVLAFFIGWRAGLITVLVYVFTLLVIRFARARLGGMTGDVFGLIVELSEVLILIGFCIEINPVWK